MAANNDHRKRAIILVPGFKRLEQLDARDRLVASIDFYSEGYNTSVSDGSDQEGFNMRSIVVEPNQAQHDPLQLDVFEAYWGDLIPDWSNENPWQKARRGTSLVGYWFFGGLMKSLLGRKWPPRTMFALFIAGAWLLLWYLVVLAVLLQAYLDGKADPTGPWADFLNLISLRDLLPAGTPEFLNLPVVLFIIGLFGLGASGWIADMSGFLKVYLRDDPLGDSEIGLRAKTRARVRSVFDYAHGKKHPKKKSDPYYSEIYVVAHSLGGPIAIDALAEYGDKLSNTTLFTWGSAVGTLVHQEPLVELEIGKFYSDDNKIANWIDVVFRKDWFGSLVPIPRKDPYSWSIEEHEPRFPAAQQLIMPKGLGLKASRIHDDYYRSEEAIGMLVGPASELPQLP